MKLREVLSGLASDLSDNAPGAENVTFSRDDLLKWYNEARCVIASLRPDKYTCNKTIELCPGSIQRHCDCTSITSVLGQVDKYGAVIRQVPRGSGSITSRWNRKKCIGGDGEFALSGYSPTTTSDGTFTVSPPVPAGQKVYLSVMCRVNPKALTLADLDKDVADIDCAVHADAVQWVLGRALMTYDSGEPVRRAQMAYAMFFNLLGRQLTTELASSLGVQLLPTKA